MYCDRCVVWISFLTFANARSGLCNCCLEEDPREFSP